MNNRKDLPRRKPALPLVTGAVLLALHAGAGHAAQPPDAGRTSRDLQLQPPMLLPRPAPRLDIEPAPRPPLAAPDDLKIQVAGFRITGASLYPESELQALLQNALGRELGLAELEAEAARITAHYRAHGYPFARAWLPAQDIRDGLVEIAVLEGRYGKIDLDNRSTIPDGHLSSVLSGLEPQTVIDGAALERGLLLLSDLPGVEVKSTLKPGASVGTADLVVEALPGKPLSGAIDVDNYGNRFTGEYRLGASVNLANPANLGDLLTLRGVTAGDRLHYGRLGYQIPLGGYGTRAGLAWSHMSYKLGRDFARLDAHGSARIGTAWLAHPLIRSRATNLHGQLSHEYKDLDDHIDATATTAQKTLRNWTLALNGDHRDALFGGGLTTASVAWTTGDLELDRGAAALDAATARSAGRFHKWTFDVARLQRLGEATSLYLAWSGQFADKNLDSAEKFSLGGAFGVRAYPQSEANADQGQLLNLELRYAFLGAWQAVAFVDAGRVKTHRTRWTAGDNTRHLEGAGFGLNWADGGWSARSVIAWKLGGEKPASDKDRTPRFWLQAARYF